MKRTEMMFDRFCERRRIVSPFQKTHDSPPRVDIGNVNHDLGQIGKMVALQAQRPNRVVAMAVETGADQNQLGTNLLRELFGCDSESFQLIFGGCSDADRKIDGEPLPGALTGFMRITRTGIERKSMHREKCDRRVIPKRCLSAVPVMDIPVNDQYAT